MLNNLSCYYLKQMGITPWVYRKSNTQSEQAATIKLLVLSEDNLKENEQRLLEQILFFIGLKRSEWVYGSSKTTEKPAAILSFGIHATESQVSNSLFLKLESLNSFLVNPLLKKSLYLKLIPMKHAFASS